MAFDQTIQALREQESNHWAIGDALRAEITDQKQWYKLDNVLTSEGLDYKVSTLRAYAKVARAFPPADRVPGVSFAAHQAALTVGDSTTARIAIDRATATHGRATRDAVLAEVRQIKGRTKANTANAVAAWRDLRRGVQAILSLPDNELDALLQVSTGNHAGQAPAMVRDLAKASARIGQALKVAETKAKADKARTKAIQAKAATKITPKAKTQTTEAKKPRVGRLGAGRGEG